MIYSLLIPCCVLLASSEPPNSDVHILFQQLDQNADRLIKLNEVPRSSLLFNEFEGADTNQDNAIDRKEFNRYLIIKDIT